MNGRKGSEEKTEGEEGGRRTVKEATGRKVDEEEKIKSRMR